MELHPHVSYISGAKYSGRHRDVCDKSFYFVDKTNNEIMSINGFKEFFDTGISGYYHPVGGNPFRIDEIGNNILIPPHYLWFYLIFMELTIMLLY